MNVGIGFRWQKFWSISQKILNVFNIPTQTHVEGCGFTTRQELETNELQITEPLTEPAQNDNEEIEESDIVIESFEALEN